MLILKRGNEKAENGKSADFFFKGENYGVTGIIVFYFFRTFPEIIFSGFFEKKGVTKIRTILYIKNNSFYDKKRTKKLE